ncbi:response regulator transcription factor [Frondihabitans australicus]|uniref:LuxR family two component transcriptional regulator n=1 Tax=Frondihabitans australicus TaxID=386892 RepID=A0A495IE77_9MICO|nr:response regulator transcription factor [Frondihabitans australicus]RKR73306.1 LuxR family two component transcriptional regulator [Frondihabitans australicus]
MIRVLLVDDQEMIRLGLRTILEAHESFEVVGDVADGFEALAFVQKAGRDGAQDRGVDLVLMDVRMPGIDGVETTRRLRETHAATELKIVVLTTFEQDSTVLAALRAGANGFLGKGVGPAALAEGLLEVVAGGGTLSPAASAAVIGHVTEQPAVVVDQELAERFSALTARERDVVIAIATGRDNDTIAAELFVSPFTVKTHASRAMAKVGARDRAQLVALAYRAGLA